MAELPMAQIDEAVRQFDSYHFRMEYAPGIFFEGDLNGAEGQQHYQIGRLIDGIPRADIYWQGQSGFGTCLGLDSWARLRGSPLPNLQQVALEILKEHEPIAVHEAEQFWSVEVQPEHLPPREDPEYYVHHVFGEALNAKSQKVLQRITDLFRELEVRITIIVSRENFRIEQMAMVSSSQEARSDFSLTFDPPVAEVARPPADVEDRLAPGFAVWPEMLLFRLNTLGGWDFPTEHGPWAQWSIQLIEEQEEGLPDAQRKYQEIYRRGKEFDFAEKLFPTHPPLIIAQIPKVKQDEAQDIQKPVYHPIILGTNHEDSTGWPPGIENPPQGMPNFYEAWLKDDTEYSPNHFFSQKPYGRYYHHFGGDDQGLEYRSYMFFDKHPPCTTTNGAGKDSYYSARDWGFGLNRVDEDLTQNRLNFTQAIRQYHRYSWPGKRNAYLMLGHVIHLLQDQGEPDHALLFAHPASGHTEKEAYDLFPYCEIIATQAAAAAAAACGAVLWWICGASTYGLTYWTCKEAANNAEVGFERLIKDYWRPNRVTAEGITVTEKVNKTGILHQPTYDDYFHTLSAFTEKTLLEIKQEYPDVEVECPLGCGSMTFTVGATVPGLDPDILVSDPFQTTPFFTLTDRLAPTVIGLSAGLIQHFYDIVNYPPYVERVMVVQWEPDAQPLRYGSFSDDHMHCVRYDAEWKISQTGRDLIVHKSYPLSTDRPAYVFILFGPAGIGPIRGKTMSDVELKITGIYPPTGDPIDTRVELNNGYDDDVGQYYWGYFHPRNCGQETYSITLEISGSDYGPHFTGRQPSGAELDSEPDKLARVNIGSPNFEWIDYAPGTDHTHQLKITRYESLLETTPLPLIIDRSQERGGAVELKVLQKTWDCQWEPHWGLPSCPVGWRLDDQITRMSAVPATNTPEHFHIEAKFEITREAAVLSITPDLDLCRSGAYMFTVYSFQGEPPVQRSIKIPVEIV